MWAWVLAVASAAAGWDLAPQTWVIDTPIPLEEPLSTWSLSHGYAFRIDDADGAVGAVFVGGGTWTVALPTRREAVVAANRLARLENVAVEALAPMVDDGALTVNVDRGLLLGLEAWARLAPGLVEVGASVVDGAADEEIEVVRGRSPEEARRIALRTLEERTGWMRRHHFDPASLITVERWDPRGAWLASFRTDQTWSRFAGIETAGTVTRWLAHVHDPAGAFDPAAETVVLARDVAASGRLLRQDLARLPLAPDRRRVVLRSARASHAFAPEVTGASLIQEAVVDLRLGADGGDATVVWLDLPHVAQQAWASNPPLAHGWVLDGVEDAEGRPLEAVHLPLTGDEAEGRGASRTLAVRLSTPLPEGDETRIRVRYRDRHRYAHVLDLDNGDYWSLVTAQHGMGSATDIVRSLPAVRTDLAARAPASVRVGLPPAFARRNHAVVGGSDPKAYREGGWSWVEVQTSTARPALAIGRWKVHEDPAIGKLPAVQAAVRTGDPGELPVVIRQLLTLVDPVLPDYPVARVEVAELVAPLERLRLYVGGAGLVGFGTTHERARMRGAEASFRDRWPKYELWGLAATLHAHWWIEQRALGRDQTLPVILGTFYGIETLRAVHPPDVAGTWRERMVECAEVADGRLQPFTASGPASWCTGAAVLLGLADQVGTPAVFEAVDRTLRGEFPPTLDGLEQALEAVSERSLTEFFDVFVHGGLAPSVEARWWVEGENVVGTVHSDLPFGGLAVPLRLEGDDGELLTVAQVADGSGRFDVAWAHAAAPERLSIDPEGQLLLRGSRVRKGAP